MSHPLRLISILLLLGAILCSGCSNSQEAVTPPDVEKASASDNISLEIAIDRNDLNRVGELLRKGADPNDRFATGMCPLHTAAVAGPVEMGLLLIEQGADVNLSSKRISSDQETKNIPREGPKPLHIAVSLNRLEFGQMLIDHGADVNARDGMQRTVLDLATGKALALGHLKGVVVGAEPLAQLENQILKNQAVQEMLRKKGGKLTAEFERAKLEEKIESQKENSLLGRSSEGLKRSKIKSGTKGSLNRFDPLPVDPLRGPDHLRPRPPNLQKTERANPLRENDEKDD